MTNEKLQKLVETWNLGVEFTEEESQFLNLQVPRENLHDLMLQLRGDQHTAFDFLFCLTSTRRLISARK